MSEVLQYLDSKNVSYKIDGQEARITCPNCNKPEKLSINIQSGVYHCFRCEAKDPDSKFAKGHISQLKQEWGDIIPIAPMPVQALKDDRNQQETDFSSLTKRYVYNINEDSLLAKRAMRYLINRGFNEEIIERQQLGVMEMHDQAWISIPCFEGGLPKLIKYRKLPPINKDCVVTEKCRREKDGKSILYNVDALKEYDEIILTEGELDAITLLQYGYDNVVATTGGCTTLLNEWYEQLNLMHKITIVFDTDDEEGQGQHAARNIWAKRLGINRVYNLMLPDGYDVNSWFEEEENTKEKFDELLQEASKFTVSGIMSVADALQEMYNKSLDEDHGKYFPLPWKDINAMIGGGLAKKRLTVLGGAAGMGKTTLSLQILYHMATQYNMPGLMFCLEMPEVTLVSKIIQLHYNLVLEEVDYSDALMYSMEIGDIPIYFGYSSVVTPDIFYNTMEEVRNRYGVAIGVFDNIQRMIRTGEESDMGNASGKFKDISMDLDMPFILLSQPRKKSGDGTPTYEELKGSSAIPADADEIILLHRQRIKDATGHNSFEPRTQVIVDKSRFASGGRTFLHYDGARARFHDWNDEYEEEYR